MEDLDPAVIEPLAEIDVLDLVIALLDGDLGMAAVRDLRRQRRPKSLNDSTSRNVIRCQNGRSSSARGTKLTRLQTTTPACAGTDSRVERRSPSRGHQNSSASLLITQSAPSSAAAILAIRVTHTPCA